MLLLIMDIIFILFIRESCSFTSRKNARDFPVNSSWSPERVLACFAERVYPESRWRSNICLLFWCFQQSSFYNSGESFLDTSADNRKPQACGRVTGPCKRSISGQKDLLLSLPTGVLSLSLTVLLPYFFARLFSLCTPTDWMPWRGYVLPSQRKSTLKILCRDLGHSPPAQEPKKRPRNVVRDLALKFKVQLNYLVREMS